MNTYEGKPKANERQSVADTIYKRQTFCKSTSLSADNRPESMAQKNLQEKISRSPRSEKADHLQAMADNYCTQQKVDDVAAKALDGHNIIQYKIGEADNVIFGLEGKSEKAVKSAVTAGYTTFDGADSYGNTIAFLAAAIQTALKGGKTRKDFHVIYKIDATAAKDLEPHIRTIAKTFDGFIDQVVIHKVTDEKQASAYRPILSKLKKEGVIKAIGAGDVKADMEDHLENMDSFEVNAVELFKGSDPATFITNLNQSQKPVFVYNIIGALRTILDIDAKADITKTQLMAMVSKIKSLVPKAEPILSSSNAEKQTSNLAVFDIKDHKAVGLARTAIEDAVAVKKKRGISFDKMQESVKSRVTAILFGGYDWAAENLFEDEKQYKITKNEKLTDFTSVELETSYQGVDEDEAKTFTLRQLIEMLFDPDGNCHRVEASNFFMRGFGFLS